MLSLILHADFSNQKTVAKVITARMVSTGLRVPDMTPSITAPASAAVPFSSTQPKLARESPTNPSSFKDPCFVVVLREKERTQGAICAESDSIIVWLAERGDDEHRVLKFPAILLCCLFCCWGRCTSSTCCHSRPIHDDGQVFRTLVITVCAGTQNKWFFWRFIRGSIVEGIHFAAQCRR